MTKPRALILGILKLLGLAGVLLGLIAFDGFVMEPNFPLVMRTTVRVSDLPEQLDGVRIVQITDTHIVRFGKRESRALRKVAGIKPDLILLTGDYTGDDGITPGNYSDAYCVRQAARFMKGLHAKYGVYAVSGNWDSLRPMAEYQGIGVTWLDGKSETVHIRGVPVLVADPGGLSRHRMICRRAGVKPEAVTIVLDHFPEVVDQLAYLEPPVTLVLAGHWHGGQVGWPMEMKHVKYLAGIYEVGNTQLYVSRGLGMHTRAVRFNCPSEITLITLRRR